MNKLTCAEENFAQFYAMEGKPSAAYRYAYDTHNCTSGTVATNAQKVLNRPHVAARIYELQCTVRDEPFKVALQKKIMYLMKVIETGSQRVPNKFKDGVAEMVDSKAVISAIAELNKMDGDLATQKKHVTGAIGINIDGEDAEL
jgi:hypothetical protein